MVFVHKAKQLLLPNINLRIFNQITTSNTTIHLNSCDFEEVFLFSSRHYVLNEDLSIVDLDNISSSNGCPQNSPLKPIIIQYTVPLPVYRTWVWWLVADGKEEGSLKLYSWKPECQNRPDVHRERAQHGSLSIIYLFNRN